MNEPKLDTPVYYDKKINRFRCIKLGTSEGWMASYARHYNDAKTSIQLAPITEQYFKDNLEEVKNIEKYAGFNGVGYTVFITVKCPNCGKTIKSADMFETCVCGKEIYLESYEKMQRG